MADCAVDPRNVTEIRGIGERVGRRLDSAGLRNIGDLRRAVEDSIKHDLPLPHGITTKIVKELLGTKPPEIPIPASKVPTDTPMMEAAETAWGFQNLISHIASTVQGRIMFRSPSAVAKRILSDLAIIDVKTVDNFGGGKSGKPVEHQMKVWHGKISASMNGVEGIRRRYVLGLAFDEGKAPNAKQMLLARAGRDSKSAELRSLRMSKDGFYQAVTKTLRNGGVPPKGMPSDAAQHLEAAAKIIREEIWKPIAKDLEGLGQKSGVDPMNYVMRVYDAGKIGANRRQFHNDAIRGMRASFKKENGIEPNVREIEEMVVDIEKWTEGILSNSHTRAAKNIGEFTDAQGRIELARTIDLPDEVLEPWLRNDLREIIAKYMNTRIIDMEIVRKFGDIEMSRHFDELNVEYQTKIEKASPAKRTKLDSQWKADLRDLEATRSILRGTLDIPADPYTVRGQTERFARVIKDLNYLAYGGGFAITALGDIGSMMLVNGIRRTMTDMHQVMSHGIGFAAKQTPLDAKELAAMNLDWADVMNMRGQSIFATGDFGGQGYGAIERALHSGSRRMAEISLLSPWTNFAKQIAARGVVRRIIDVAERAEVGKASADELATISAAYMSPHQLSQVLALHRKFGGADGSTKWLGLDKWGSDAPEGLLETVRDTIVREVDRAVLTPGATDAPIFFHTLAGSVLFQFRRFGMSHTQRLLIPAMQSAKAGDLQILNAVAVSSAMGSVVFMLKQLANHREIPTDLNRIIQEGVVRSDLWGKVGDVSGLASAATGGVVGFREFLGPDTHLARSGQGGYFEALANNLSPALYSTAIESGRIVSGLAGLATGGVEDVQDSEIRAARHLAPFNTLFYMDWAFDALENGMVGARQRTARNSAIMESQR